MLNITEIKEYVAKATGQFCQVFIGFQAPKIVIVSASRRQIVRARVLQECGLDYKDDAYGTDGEVIDGPLGKQILLYQSMMKSEKRVCHTLWHEFGHIIFGNEKQYGIDFDMLTPMLSGYAILNEFMAEYIAHVASNGKGFGIYNPNMYLQMAFQESRTIIPYWLSMYFAIVMGDSTISERFIEDGPELIGDTLWTYVADMFTMLNEQLKKEKFWEISPDFVEEFGSIFDDMHSAVYSGLI